MMTHIRWSGALLGIALVSVFGAMPQAQQIGPSDNPMPVQRDDPGTSGAGPTSGAPGQYNYGPPKDGSVTTDARGVTTTQPSDSNPKPPASERGDDSSGRRAPK